MTDFSREEISLIRELQREELYLEAHPFQRVADNLGLPLDQVLEKVNELKRRGVIRRFGAALTPAKAGFKVNAMIVWDVEGADANDVGARMAGHGRVSHCYLRPPFPGFSYTLYTMTHANSEEELAKIINELKQTGGLSAYKVLKTVREIKKTSPCYFS